MQRALILITLIVLMAACEGPAGPVGPQGPAGPVGPQGPAGPGYESIFIGTWINEDEGTSDITRIVIRANSQTIFVHMWGACHPTDCDWGEETTDIADAYDNRLSLKWNFSFAIHTQVIYYLDYGRLKLDGHCHFIDNSGRSDYDYTSYFAKD